MNLVTAILMIPRTGPTPIEQNMGAALRSAALDAVEMLRRIPAIDRIIIAAPDTERARTPALDDVLWEVDPPGEFHFGERLASMIRKHDLDRVLYLGAGSMPLMNESDVAAAVDRVAAADSALAVTNNLHSADWVALSHSGGIEDISHRLERDNMLAWVLREECGFAVSALPPSAGTRLDIDTPFDLCVLALHPRTRSHLRGFLNELSPQLSLEQLCRAVEILCTPESRVTMIGRVSAAAWRHLESTTRCWTRVLSEERSMAANRRQATGQVFSFVADHISRVGEEAFVSQLAGASDLVLFDTRVYLVHHRSWPSAADRFASDWGRANLIGDERLRRLTEAATAAPTPIILGGHNVVSGGLYAMLEIAEDRPRKASHTPIR